jgi:hypothetical protein
LTKISQNTTKRRTKPVECNPIRDVMESKTRSQVVLCDADMELLRRLAENPPDPSPQLVEDLRNHLKNRDRANKSNAR